MSEMRHAITGSVVKFLGGDTSRSCRGKLTTEVEDRAKDVVVASGARLDNFRRNPTALFNHDVNQVVGSWSDVAIQGKEIVGTLTFPPSGVSARADEICGLVKNGNIAGISIGFLPLRWEPIKGSPGLRFTSWELIEASLVAVPANPDALVTQRRLSRARSPQQRLVEAARLAAELRYLDAGFSMPEARHFAAKYQPSALCGRPVSAACGLRDRDDCAIHRGR